MSRHKTTILLLTLIACAGIGYYAWQQQRLAKGALEQLQRQEDIDFHILSRPIIAINSQRHHVLLIYADRTDSIFNNRIRQIRFIESKITSNDPFRLRRPDSLQIILSNDEQINVRDLPDTAENTMTRLQAYLPSVTMVIQRQ